MMLRDPKVHRSYFPIRSRQAITTVTGILKATLTALSAWMGGGLHRPMGYGMQIFSPAPSPILSITTELMEAEAVVVRTRAAAVRTPVGAVRIRAVGAIPIPVCG